MYVCESTFVDFTMVVKNNSNMWKISQFHSLHYHYQNIKSELGEISLYCSASMKDDWDHTIPPKLTWDLWPTNHTIPPRSFYTDVVNIKVLLKIREEKFYIPEYIISPTLSSKDQLS